MDNYVFVSEIGTAQNTPAKVPRRYLPAQEQLSFKAHSLHLNAIFRGEVLRMLADCDMETCDIFTHSAAFKPMHIT